MDETYATLSALFADIADAIREKTGDTDSIVADDFPDVIRESLEKAPPKPYLTFSSPNSFTLKTSNVKKNWDGTLEYSTDASTWSIWDGTTTLSSATRWNNDVLYLRGTGNTKITGDNVNYRWVLTGSDIKCKGNIENLLDYPAVESGEHPIMANYCYARMFQGCTSLTQPPELPATTLMMRCYQGMFFGCTSLIQAPVLPATTLASYCYAFMFANCTSLTQAPALPAITLASTCYYQMFYGCTSLTQLPALPATTLADTCYQQMFQGCTSLTQAPALPATTLAFSCYKNMFYGCTSLTQAPKLPATTLADYCYDYMFYNCTSLIQAPELLATTLSNDCYSNMFSGCTSLTQAPALPATTLANYCYRSMFEGCTNLTQIPSLSATNLLEYSYGYMFNNCTKLKFSTTQTGEYTIAYRIPKTGTGTDSSMSLYAMFTGTGGTFKGTPSINTTYYLSNTNQVISPPPPYLTFSSPSRFALKVNDTTKHWDGTLEYSKDTSTWSTWDGTIPLSSATNGSSNVLYLRGTGNTVITGNNSNYRWVLTGSDISFTGNIENLLDYATVASGAHPTMADNCYRCMFYECTSLTQAPELSATTLTSRCYDNMFYNCSSLTQTPALPATTLANYCYYSMFGGCTALTKAPELPATMLADSCYSFMFYRCSNLTQAPELPATTLANYCYSYMFSQCAGLTQAPALPATTLAERCYSYMFEHCTSLTQAPALPAITLADYCYGYMFCGCTSLKLSTTQTGEYTQEYRIPSSGTGTTATNALSSMFSYTGGTFKETPAINTTYYLSNTNTIV